MLFARDKQIESAFAKAFAVFDGVHRGHAVQGRAAIRSFGKAIAIQVLEKKEGEGRRGVQIVTAQGK